MCVRFLAVLLVANACDRVPDEQIPTPQPAPPVPIPPKPGMGPPIDAAPPPADAPPVDAAPAIPADLAAAPAWSGRSFYTGHIRAKAVHSTATLQRVGDRALVTVDIRETPLRLDGKPPPPFGPPVRRTFLGTFDGKQLVYADGGETITLPCTTQTVRVAAATAVRIREGKGGCEGDRGKWSPAKTRAQKALVCGDMSSELDPSYTFVEPPAPAIEYLWVNDDCSMQGGGYRDVPPDGSIHPGRVR